MSTFDGPDVNVLHEADVRDVIQAEIETTVGLNAASIADASEAHALNSVFSDTEVEAALNALGVKINDILAVLRTNGIIDEPGGG